MIVRVNGMDGECEVELVVGRFGLSFFFFKLIFFVLE